MRVVVYFACFLLVLTSGQVRAQKIEASVSKSLFYFHSADSTSQPKPYLELYWQVNPKTVRFVTTEKGIQASMKVEIWVAHGNDTLKQDKFILQTPPKNDVAELATISIIDLRKYFIQTGTTRFGLRLTDLQDTNYHYVFTDSIHATEITDYKYSSIEIADTILKNNTKSEFLKHGLQVIPICADFLDNPKRTISYYAELYHITTLQPNRYPLIQRIRISRKPDELFVPGYEKDDTLNFMPQFAAGSLPIGTLVSGNYYISIAIEDKQGITLAKTSRFFQRLNTNPDKEAPVITATAAAHKEEKTGDIFNDTAMESVTVLNLDKTFLAKFDMSQIRAILKMLLPVSDMMQTNTIRNFLKKPDDMYMRYFIYNHFHDINEKDPAAAWKAYSEKVRDVNRKFSAEGLAGYETERGFIYLRYGPPTDIITVSNEVGTRPYQIWQYNTLTQFTNQKELTNALFLFYRQSQMIGDYKLLHSTVPGEVNNSAWRTYLYDNQSQVSSTGFELNTRAEQYFGAQPR